MRGFRRVPWVVAVLLWTALAVVVPPLPHLHDDGAAPLPVGAHACAPGTDRPHSEAQLHALRPVDAPECVACLFGGPLTALPAAAPRVTHHTSTVPADAPAAPARASRPLPATAARGPPAFLLFG